jgi:hypothetical protein
MLRSLPRRLQKEGGRLIDEAAKAAGQERFKEIDHRSK